ncbi:MAG: 4-hydroxy-tetrahydrodipicolinate synthase [Turicibacter sp.]|nr:4-hydroxy-tetrahydrodipicolinate synthase [Turicibacter sp.]
MCDLNFGPLITAAVTPFDECGQVDLRQLEKLITHLLDHHSTSILLTGTTGEAPTLNAIEKLRIWERAVDFIDGRVPTIAGVGTNNTKATIHNAKLAEEAEVDALLVVVPYYNKPSQKGLLKHFKLVAENTDLPIILYNIPSRCGTGLTIQTILELAKIPNIIGIKESTGDMALLTKLKLLLPEDFLLYSGDDALYLDTLKLGGAGVVSVSSHLVGKKMMRIYDLLVAGWTLESEDLNTRLLPFYQAIFTYPNPSPVKALLAKYGIDVGGVRLPLASLEEHEADALWEEVEDVIDQ